MKWTEYAEERMAQALHDTLQPEELVFTVEGITYPSAWQQIRAALLRRRPPQATAVISGQAYREGEVIAELSVLEGVVLAEGDSLSLKALNLDVNLGG